jgi:hypothetical protein
MGCFNDLPKDVKWLIFQWVIREFFKAYYVLDPEQDILKCAFFVTNPNDDPSILCHQMCVLSLIDKKSLSLIRSKCYRSKYINHHMWRFKSW